VNKKYLIIRKHVILNIEQKNLMERFLRYEIFVDKPLYLGQIPMGDGYWRLGTPF